MPAKSRVSSWFSRRFKKHDSSPLASPSHSPGNSAGSLDAPNSHPASSLPPSQQLPLLLSSDTDISDVPSYHARPKPSSSSHHPPSGSSASPAYAANNAGVGHIPGPRLSTHRLDDSTCQNNSPTNPRPTAPPQLPQTQASTPQGPSVSVV
jgi:hypothetical protein